MSYFQNGNAFPEALSYEDERKYISQMEKGDEKAKDVLIVHNLRLVAHVCKKYASSNVSQEDLISIGSIGLIKGISTYNSKKSIKLSTYISKCIDNEILMHFRSIKKQSKEVHLDDPIGKDKDDNAISLKDILENDEKSIDDEIDLKIKRDKLNKKMKEILKERERIILVERFGLDGNKTKTQKEIAKEMNISRSYVSRIETKAIERLTRELNSN